MVSASAGVVACARGAKASSAAIVIKERMGSSIRGRLRFPGRVVKQGRRPLTVALGGAGRQPAPGRTAAGLGVNAGRKAGRWGRSKRWPGSPDEFRIGAKAKQDSSLDGIRPIFLSESARTPGHPWDGIALNRTERLITALLVFLLARASEAGTIVGTLKVPT